VTKVGGGGVGPDDTSIGPRDVATNFDDEDEDEDEDGNTHPTEGNATLK
jgi:hypothetical protein